MNNTYLTQYDIAELKAIRANFIIDSELSELSNFLKANGKKLTTDSQTNRNNVYLIIHNYFMNKVINKPENEILYRQMTAIQYPDLLQEFIFKMMPKYAPEMLSVWEIAKKIDFRLLKASLINYVSNHTDSRMNFNIDVDGFILDPSFDLNEYGAKSLNKDLETNTTAICNAYQKFFDTVTKGLNPEQKTIVKDGFIESLTLYLYNSTDTMVKDKDRNYRNMSDYIYHKSNK